MKYCDGCHDRKFCEWRSFTRQAHDGHFIPINCPKEGKSYKDGYYDGWIEGHRHASEEAMRMKGKIISQMWMQLVEEVCEKIKADE